MAITNKVKLNFQNRETNFSADPAKFIVRDLPIQHLKSYNGRSSSELNGTW